MAFPIWSSQQPVFDAISVAKPAAGNVSYSAVVPAGQQWLVKTVCVQLVTNATAGNRTLFLIGQANPLGLRLGTIFSTVLQPASKTYEYTFAPDGFANDVLDNALGYVTLGIPEFVLPAGGSIGIGCFGIQSTDQLQSLVVGVEITKPYQV
jgi:hypothetical protein